jgi:hypothetical protein
MSQALRSIAIGVASGIATYFAARHALGLTSAFVLPDGFPLVLWEILVVFGLGATLVALIIHLTALGVTRPKKSHAFAGFVVAILSCLAAAGLLQYAARVVAAVVLGALLATGIACLRPNHSFKPTPSARLNSRR